jgi:Tol biopolymer transport system component/PKD repeat protein
MRLRFTSYLKPTLALGALLAGCSEPNRPVSPKSNGPQFSQTAANGGGGKITFQSNRNGNVDVFVMNPDGSVVTQLTNHPFDDFLPLFSPDGSRIDFGRCGFGRCDIVVINADGSGERTVLFDGFPGAWSPDGNRIALGKNDGIWIVNADGTGLVRVADPQFVTDWSPDGRQLMLANNFDGDFELYAMNLDGSGVTKLTDNNANDYPGRGAAWSRPDGTRILFTSDRGGTGEQNIYVMNADGTGVTQLTPNDGFNDVGPSWSPDATHIVFESNRAGDEQIFVMNADGSGITQLTSGAGVMNSGAHWIRQVAPANDDFANATGVPALPFSSVAQLVLAGTESGEQTPSCAVFYGPVNETVWYSFTPAQTQSITARIGNASISTVVAAYSGSSVSGLTELGCVVFGGNVTFRAQAGTTYHFLVGNLFGQEGQAEFRLEVTPPPQANFGTFPFDPSMFDLVQFQDFSFDPAFIGFEPPQWSFGDGTSGTGFFPTHRYAADGDYPVELTVTTHDGRSASTSRALQVRTHDVAIAKFQTPPSGMTGKTSKIAVDIRSNRYPETVEVQLFKSVPGGFQLVATSTQTLPTRNRVTSVAFSYTFAPEDATIGKVTFKAVANLLGARDALPADNEAIAPPTKITK